MQRIIFFLWALALCATSAKAALTWTSIGPAGATIQSAAISPGYPLDGTMFAVDLFSKAVYRTNDAGIHWTTLTSFAGNNLEKVVVSPNYRYGGSDQTVFVGGLAVPLQRSTNSGNTWTQPNLPAYYIYDIAISPAYSTDHTVFVASDQGVFRSLDSGVTFTKVSGFAEKLLISPSYATDHTVFASSNGNPAGLVKTTDGGASWSNVGIGIPASYQYNGPKADNLAISPNYAVDQTLFFADEGGVLYYSKNGGGSWSAITSNYFGGAYTYVAITPDFATDHLVITRDRRTSTYMGLTTDFGQTWTDMTDIGPIVDVLPSPQYDIDHKLFVTTEFGGLYKTVIPEPTSLALVAAPMLVLCRRSRSCGND